MKFLLMCIILISFFSLRIFGVHALSTSINTQYSTNNTEIKQLYIVSSTSKPTLTTPISTTQTTLPPTVILDGKRLLKSR